MRCWCDWTRARSHALTADTALAPQLVLPDGTGCLSKTIRDPTQMRGNRLNLLTKWVLARGSGWVPIYSQSCPIKAQCTTNKEYPRSLESAVRQDSVHRPLTPEHANTAVGASRGRQPRRVEAAHDEGAEPEDEDAHTDGGRQN
jgi:hypothetical protein